MVSYLNTAVFSAAKFFTVMTRECENVIAITFVSITFVIFVFILAYHIHTEVSLKVWKRLKLMRSRKGENVINNPPIDCVVRPTFSSVDGVPSRQGSPLIQHETDETINELIQVSSCQLQLMALLLFWRGTNHLYILNTCVRIDY